MQVVKILEAEPRKSKAGKEFWQVRYLVDGHLQPSTAYIWDSKLADGLQAGQIKQVEILPGQYPHIIKIEDAPQDADWEFFDPSKSPAVGERDIMIARHVALKAAAQIANLGATPQEVIECAEQFLQWLLGKEED